MDRGAWWATVHGVTDLDTNEATYACIHILLCVCFWRIGILTFGRVSQMPYMILLFNILV